MLIFLSFFSRFLYIPLYEQYYFVRFGSDLLQNTSYVFPNGSTSSFCLNSSVIDNFAGQDSHKVVEKYSNNLVLYGQIAARVPSMIIVLIMGPLSDHFGRKPVLISSLIGTTLQAVMTLHGHCLFQLESLLFHSCKRFDWCIWRCHWLACRNLFVYCRCKFTQVEDIQDWCNRRNACSQWGSRTVSERVLVELKPLQFCSSE